MMTMNPLDEDRSAGRWCEHCGQHGGHHTDQHERFKTYKQVCDEVNRRDGELLWDQGVVEADRREDHERWVRAGRPCR